MTEFEDSLTPQDQDMLRVTPNEFITFSRGENSESFVEIASISKIPVTYKIQTTSPEKFRVRPRCGVLNPGETVSVSIVLKPDQYLAEASKDKFLVMGLPVPMGVDITTQMSEIWKQKVSNSPEVEQHRLCCTYKNGNDAVRNGAAGGAHDEAGGNNRSVTIMELSKQVDQLKNQTRSTQIIITITLLFLVVFSGYTIYLLRLQSLSPVKTVEMAAQIPDTNCQLHDL